MNLEQPFVVAVAVGDYPRYALLRVAAQGLAIQEKNLEFGLVTFLEPPCFNKQIV